MLSGLVAAAVQVEGRSGRDAEPCGDCVPLKPGVVAERANRARPIKRRWAVTPEVELIGGFEHCQKLVHVECAGGPPPLDGLVRWRAASAWISLMRLVARRSCGWTVRTVSPV